MDKKGFGADPALVNGAAKSVSTLTGFDQGEESQLIAAIATLSWIESQANFAMHNLDKGDLAMVGSTLSDIAINADLFLERQEARHLFGAAGMVEVAAIVDTHPQGQDPAEGLGS